MRLAWNRVRKMQKFIVIHSDTVIHWENEKAITSDREKVEGRKKVEGKKKVESRQGEKTRRMNGKEQSEIDQFVWTTKPTKSTSFTNLRFCNQTHHADIHATVNTTSSISKMALPLGFDFSMFTTAITMHKIEMASFYGEQHNSSRPHNHDTTHTHTHTHACSQNGCVWRTSTLARLLHFDSL